MSIKWETELLESVEEDDADHVMYAGDDEEACFVLGECASEPCLGDWLRLAF